MRDVYVLQVHSLIESNNVKFKFGSFSTRNELLPNRALDSFIYLQPHAKLSGTLANYNFHWNATRGSEVSHHVLNANYPRGKRNDGLGIERGNM